VAALQRDVPFNWLASCTPQNAGSASPSSLIATHQEQTLSSLFKFNQVFFASTSSSSSGFKLRRKLR